MSTTSQQIADALKELDPEEAAHLQELLEESEEHAALTESNAKKSRKTQAFIVGQYPGEPEVEAFARAELQPSTQAALTLMNWGNVLPCEQDCNALAKELQKQATAASGNDLSRMEAMLAIQAHSLDAMFNDMARRAAWNRKDYFEAHERFLRLAFKAQSQCRATIETLAEIKNPRTFSVVKQANIANGPQQVNNNAARVQEPSIRSNELLEPQHERLDTRPQIEAIPADSLLATMGAVNRTQVSAGQGQREAKQPKARRVQRGVQGPDGTAEETQGVGQ